jgi:hypothetical protein
MKLRRLPFHWLGVLLLGAIVSTQTRPDFSGRWTSDPDPAAARGTAEGGRGRGPSRGDMGSGWGTLITITQDASRLTVEYAFFGRGDMQRPLRFDYAMDGSETKNSVMMGRGIQSQTSTTTWDGDTFIISTRHAFTDPSTGQPATAQVTQALTLESPTSLVVETTRAGVLGGPTTKTRTVYRKL